MSTSTRLIGLILATSVLVSGVAAEELPLPGPTDLEPPTELHLPSFERGAVPSTSAPLDGQSLLVGPTEPFVGPLDVYEEAASRAYDLWDTETAPIESTGTWLRRGLWYVEADAVVLNRQWSRDDLLLAAEDPNVNFRTAFPPFTLFTVNTNRLLYLTGAQPGEDTSVRVTLGRFLHRDTTNRDHTAEFTAFGGGDWVQDSVLTSLNPFGLQTPFIMDGGNRSFDNSNRQTVKYSSHYSSFEANYRVKQRMGRDQIIMDANGCWHRSANAGFTRDFLVGLRMMELRDIFDWRAEDIAGLGNDGAYLIRTDNDLFGFQLGAGFAYETSRWSLGLSGKGGVYLNDVLGRSTLDFTVDDDDDFDLRMSTDELSFIGEARLQGKWHLTTDFSLRAGCELMYITSTALAPHQATFITEFSQLSSTGDPFYFGASFGFEGYW